MPRWYNRNKAEPLDSGLFHTVVSRAGFNAGPYLCHCPACRFMEVGRAVSTRFHYTFDSWVFGSQNRENCLANINTCNPLVFQTVVVIFTTLKTG